MILGSGQTWATRLADAEGDKKIAARMLEAIAYHFTVPATPNPEEILYEIPALPLVPGYLPLAGLFQELVLKEISNR